MRYLSVVFLYPLHLNQSHSIPAVGLYSDELLVLLQSFRSGHRDVHQQASRMGVLTSRQQVGETQSRVIRNRLLLRHAAGDHSDPYALIFFAAVFCMLNDWRSKDMLYRPPATSS